MAERLSDFESSYNAIDTDNANARSWRTSIPITVEPAVFLLCLSTTLTSPVLTNLFLVHTCEVTLGNNNTICEELADKKLNNSHALEVSVQHEATYFAMGKSLIEACLPAILSFYIGPWSDINGRKPLIKWPMLGYCISYIVYLVESFFPGLPPYVLMVSGMPAALCGGFIAFISGTFSYISDISQPEKRTLRMGMIEVALFAGLLAGTLSSSYIYNSAGTYGYAAVFGVASFCCLLSWLYCCFFLRESVINDESEYPCCCLSKGLFKKSFVMSMLSVCWEKRPNYGRAISLLVIVVLSSCVFTLDGESAVIFLFVREKFNFDLHDFTIFTSIAIGINIAGVFFGTHVLSKWIKVSTAVLAAFGFFVKIFAAIVCAFSPRYWYLYIGAAISFLGACVGPWCRAFLSITVPKADIGKVFSLVATLEAFCPIAASALYTLVYNFTLSSFPGAFCFLSAGIFALNLVLLLVVLMLQRRNWDEQYLHDHLIDQNKTNHVPDDNEYS